MESKKQGGMRAVIVANGRIDPVDGDWLRDSDLIIAADGGAFHCQRFNVLPDLLVGDFDSVDPALLADMTAKGVPVLRHSPRKDQTDLELALAEAKARGAGDIVILGGLGGRWDMTLATVLGLAAKDLPGIRVRLVAAATEIILLRGRTRHVVRGRPGDTLSLLPLGEDAVGVTLQGLEYPLSEATIEAGTALGVSNVFTGDCAEIMLAKGLLLCVHTRTEATATA